jgi:uncharacterized protein YbjT (DUF2867 family)
VILVIGAGGKVGRPAVERLLDKGEAVRALTRDPEKMADRWPGVEAVAGDLDRPETLPAAFQGVESALVISAGNDVAGEDANAIDAATAAGVGHVVLLSSQGAMAGVASGPFHAPGEERLRASGLSWTILRPAIFMANAVMWRDTIKAQGVFYEPTGTGAHAMIHPSDIGEVAAEVLATPGHEGQIYELTGPEAITSADCAAALSAVLGTEVRHVDIPDQAFRQAMTGSGAPPVLVDSLARYYAMVRAGDFDRVTPAVADILGRPGRTFGQWASENAAAFA